MSGPTVVVSVLADSNKFKKTMQGISNSLSPLKSAAHTIGRVIAGGLAVGSAAFAGFLALSLKSVANIQRLNAQTKAVLKSTNSAAGQSFTHLQKVSDALERLTGKEAETVQEAQNLLLTFTQIKGKNFDEATKAALDLSTAMGTDTKSSAILLGKALNNPVKGISALTRVGVSFSQKQKDVIAQFVATGQTAKAQAVILAEVNKEFGGSAAAFGTTFSGAWAKVKNSFGTLGEQIVSKLSGPATHVLEKLNTLFLNIGDSGQLSGALAGVGKLIDKFADLIPASLDASGGIAGLMSTFSPFIEALKLLSPLVAEAVTQIGGELGQAIIDLTPSLVALLVALLPLLPPLVKLVVAIVPPLVSLLSVLVPIIITLVGWITPFFTALKLIIDLLDGDTSLKKFTKDAQGLTGPMSSAVALGNRVGAMFAGLGVFIVSCANKISGFGAAIANFAITSTKNIVNFISGIAGKIGNLGSTLYSAGRSLIQGFLNGAASLLVTVGSFFASKLPAIIQGPFKAALGIHSPSTVFEALGKFIPAGLIKGIKGQLSLVSNTMGSLSDTVVNGFSPTAPGFAPGGGGGSVPSIEIHVDGGFGTGAEIGRAIADALDEYYRRNGKR